MQLLVHLVEVLLIHLIDTLQALHFLLQGDSQRVVEWFVDFIRVVDVSAVVVDVAPVQATGDASELTAIEAVIIQRLLVLAANLRGHIDGLQLFVLLVFNFNLLGFEHIGVLALGLGTGRTVFGLHTF